MCGIVGVCNFNGEPASPVLLQRMTDAIIHRGPDGEGHFSEEGVGLGNRRLAIIDLTAAGRQPMSSRSGRTVIVYNGEIYNFQELRLELEALGYQFRSRSDTEVLLNAIEEWGDAAVERFNGHFAFAAWDRKEKKLLLARDRFGVKPLYYYHHGSRLIFGSEIAAILADPTVMARVDRLALDEYFTFQNVLSQRTLFEKISLLPAATLLKVNLRDGRVEQRRYWDFSFRPDETMAFEDAAEVLSHRFETAVVRQLVSDVPVGSYLSGGLDSGAIVAVAGRSLPRLRTFTGGFDLSSASGLELGFDERRQAEFLANLLKTEHYEMVMHAGDMEYILPELTRHLEDLRVGQSYPNYYIARLASRFVKVVLSGAGGDELFGGYPWRYLSIDQRGDEFYRAHYGFWQRLVSDSEKGSFFNPSVKHEIHGHSTYEAYRSVFRDDMPVQTREQALDAALYFELKTFLHGGLMVEDKVSMAHSLETRTPFLDNDLVEFAMRVPGRYKLRETGRIPPISENQLDRSAQTEVRYDVGKAILRRAMFRILPEDTTARAKQGFSAPDGSWFRGESIEYVRRMLLDPKARFGDYLEPKAVASIVEDHCSGRSNRRLLIWSLLSFETWCREFSL